MTAICYNNKHSADECYAFQWDTGLQSLVFTILSPAFHILWLYLYERFWKQRRDKQVNVPEYPIQYVKSEDVLEEEKRVEETDPEDEAIYVKKVTKGYRMPDKHPSFKMAVHEASFGVSLGEVFSVLGPSRAGKTTLLKTLANVLQANKGEIIIKGQKVTSQDPLPVGYCPQEEAIMDHLTVMDHFELYSVAKGIPSETRAEEIKSIISNLELTSCKDTEANKLSVGNQRKLLVGLAVLGNPDVLILDEPTAMADPQTRRNIWEVIAFVAQTRGKAAVVIGTHSLEEAEALSTKLAIMINGTFRCFGTPQAIKGRHAVGYFIDIKFEEPSNETSQQFIDSLGISLELGTSFNVFLMRAKNRP